MNELREGLKRLTLGVATVLVLPLILIVELEQAVTDDDAWFGACGEALSLVPGKPGSYLRLAFYRWTIEECGRDVVFSFGTKINHRGARIGGKVIFGCYCNIGTVTIDAHTLIGSRVCIPSGGHQHDFADLTKDITDEPPSFQTVHIGGNTWIGEGAIVLANVGSRCVVAAGSVVFRAVPDGAIAMGNPARTVSRAFTAAQFSEQLV